MLGSLHIRKILGAKGRAAVLSVKANGTYDPSTLTYTSGVTTDYDLLVYTSSFKDEEINGDTIQFNDQKTLIPATDTSGNSLPQIEVEDTLTINGKVYRIMYVQTIYEGSTPVLYLCGAR